MAVLRIAADQVTRLAAGLGGGLRHWRVRWKLVVVVLGPTLVAVVLAVTSATQSWRSVADYNHAAELVRAGGQVNALVDALQQERDITATFVVSGRAVNEDQVTTTRHDVDRAAADYRNAVTEIDTSDDQSLGEVVRRADADLKGLAFVRDAVTSAGLTEGAIRATYTDTIASLFAVATHVSAGADSRISTDLRVLADMFQIKEQASQARAQLGAILTAGAFTIGALQDFTGILARQRAAVDALQADGSDEQRTTYANAVQGQAVSRVQTDQTAAVEQATASQLSIDPAGSFTAATEKVALLHTVQTQLLDGVIAHVDAVRDEALWSAWVAISTLALVVALAPIVSTVVARSMGRSLQRLRSSALHVADTWLPDVTEQLRHTNVASVAQVRVAPVDVDAHDEIGEVARAFDKTAAAVAHLVREQAQLRSRMNSAFIDLARRNQRFAERTLHELDEWEQQEIDTDRLARLFTIDHLTTRMRRTADSLMIIAGAQTPITRTGHTSLDDVVSAALSEIEHYTRVTQQFTNHTVSIVGDAVPNVVHLLAELLDNATTYSLLSAALVTVSYSQSARYPNAIIVSIRDHGDGMSPEHINEANQRIVSPDTIDGSRVASMGLIVVGRLAARHGISVQLRPTKSGGITAIVVLPATVLRGNPADRQLGTPRAIGPVRRPSVDTSPLHAAPHSGFPQIGPGSTSETGGLGPPMPVRTMSQRDAMAMRRYLRRLARQHTTMPGS